MKLTAGLKAKPFRMQDASGRTIDLNDFTGSKVLISFFRDVTCPFCNLRVHFLSSKKQELEDLGLKMIFFFESTGELLTKSTHHQKVHPVPLVPDPEHKMYDQYGVESSTGKVLKTMLTKGAFSAMKEGNSFETPTDKEKHLRASLIPADFLINEKGYIHAAHYGKNVRDHLPIEQIKAFARQLVVG
tara:strand:- start:117 stop:677 length:561 start_codon:yes stop_codon:yes gene_type:complete